jgi:spore germination protein YaaH
VGSDGILHVVWFKDARSFDARAALVTEYDLQGLSIWTIMRFDARLTDCKVFFIGGPGIPKPALVID